MGSEIELKPCPFCGCSDISVDDDGDYEWLKCDWCGATSGFDPAPEYEAEPLAFHWNRRLSDQSQAAEIERWRQNSIDTWAAMTAMRNSINEYVPMPSMESDLLQGPENSVFCAAVATAVIEQIERLTEEVKRWQQIAQQTEDRVNAEKVAYVRLHDLWEAAEQQVQKLREALSECQTALAMMVDPKSIKNNSIPAAWATCVAAEVKARTALNGADHEAE